MLRIGRKKTETKRFVGRGNSQKEAEEQAYGQLRIYLKATDAGGLLEEASPQIHVKQVNSVYWKCEITVDAT